MSLTETVQLTVYCQINLIVQNFSRGLEGLFAKVAIDFPVSRNSTRFSPDGPCITKVSPSFKRDSAPLIFKSISFLRSMLFSDKASRSYLKALLSNIPCTKENDLMA